MSKSGKKELDNHLAFSSEEIDNYKLITGANDYVVVTDKNDKVVWINDGFADQFGGEEGRKFMPYRFKELLLEIQGKSMRQQRNLLLKSHEKWKGKRNQIDDILVMGVKF